MSGVVLVLNADFSLLEVVDWQAAVSMLILDKVRMVEEYAGRFLRSTSVTMPFPAVVVRTEYVKTKRRTKFSRKNVLARDSYTCQYCGAKPRRSNGSPDLAALTLDHVVPRAQSKDGWVMSSGKRVRITSWENITTACEPCNALKADRTPQQAQMTLRRPPRPPTAVDVVWMGMFRHTIPSEWKDYLPENSPWRDYWDGELEAD